MESNLNILCSWLVIIKKHLKKSPQLRLNALSGEATNRVLYNTAKAAFFFNADHLLVIEE